MTQYNGRVNVLVTDVKVSEAYDPKSGAPEPALVDFRAIWDTGASASVINAKVVAALKLQPIDKQRVRTANGERLADVYLVNIYLPNRVAAPAVRVTEADIVGNEDVLIGMDIIGVGDFAVTHADGKTCMSFRIPSLKRIDYVAEASSNKPALSPDEARQLRNKRKRERREGRR